MQQFTGSVFPFSKLIYEIAEMQFMNDHFNSFLHIFIRAVFPKVFKIWNDGTTVRNNPFRYRSENLIIGVINQMKECRYFLVFQHAKKLYVRLIDVKIEKFVCFYSISRSFFATNFYFFSSLVYTQTLLISHRFLSTLPYCRRKQPVYKLQQ